MPGAGSLPPFGKTVRDENFPVGSWLIAAPLRPCIAAFYAFARAADDIADDPDLSSGEKLARLDAFAKALDGQASHPMVAARLHDRLLGAGVPSRHAHDLLAAFRQDAVTCRYESWGDLIAYCDRSAAPVGRFLLDLHGEDRSLWPAADALSTALQILNHLQDCREDYERLQRVYLPQDWLRQAGAREDELRGGATTGMLRVVHRVLDGADALLADAAALPGAFRSRRLALESAVVLRLARRLSARLRRRNPITHRVRLNSFDFLVGGVGGIAAGLCR